MLEMNDIDTVIMVLHDAMMQSINFISFCF